MTTQTNPQVFLNEQIKEFEIATEKLAIEKFRHKLLEKLVKERNNSAFESIDFKVINKLIEEVYREFGYE